MPSISLPAALLGTAAIGAGTALYSANAANGATSAASAANANATTQSIAAQQAARDQNVALQNPYVQAGYSALPGLVNAVTGAPAASTAKASGVSTGTTVPPPAANGTPAQAGGQPDWDAYLAANPDVAQWAASGHGDPSLGSNQTPEQAAAYQYQNSGQGEGRQLPTTPVTAPTQAPAVDPNAPAPDLGTASPVVPDYTRPDQGAAPTFGAAPSASDFINPANFTTSPGYQFRLSEADRNLNAGYGAKGLLKSGSAIKGFTDYSQSAASSEYQNWFNQQQQLYSDAANQFNTDRSSGLAQYNTSLNNTNTNFNNDRSYGTNLAISNRDFANSQNNTRVANLFSLAQLGTGAAANTANANTNYANSSQNIYGAQANAAAGAANSYGSTASQLGGALGGVATNLFNNYTTPAASTGFGTGGGAYDATSFAAPSTFKF